MSNYTVSGTDPIEPIFGPRMLINIRGKEMIGTLEWRETNPTTPADQLFQVNINGMSVRVSRRDVIDEAVA